MNVLRPLIEFCGIEAERLHNRWISSAEAPEFAEEIHMFVEKVRKLGPSPLAKPTAAHPAEKAA
jgi:F420-non-reducing hydrogenase iron-sulfur subunit